MSAADTHRHGRSEPRPFADGLHIQDQQTQSPFFSKFPREVRDAIYPELWRSEGLAQHVFWHRDKGGSGRPGFCFWPCTTEFCMVNEAQDEFEKARAQGEHWRGLPVSPLWHARLHSQWLNHWRCEEALLAALERAGLPADRYEASGERLTRFHCPCELGGEYQPKSYLPVLLTCKAMHLESFESLYEMTRFVFVDTTSLQAFLGGCGGFDRVILATKPYVPRIRWLDISLPLNFPTLLSCFGLYREKHWGNDFHWLHLSEMTGCKEINIYVDARRRDSYVEPRSYLRWDRMMSLDHATFLVKVVYPMARDLRGLSLTITISTPLSRDKNSWSRGLNMPSDHNWSGLLDDFKFLPNLRVWKRYWGDVFHPIPPSLGLPEGAIYSSYDLPTIFDGDFVAPPEGDQSVALDIYRGSNS